MPYQVPAPRSEYEEAVQQAGYRWVQTVRLHPYGTTDAIDHPFRIFDNLGRHNHSAANTHLIIAGQLRIITETGREFTINADDDRMKEVRVGGGTYYRGEAGPQGATFVEGHACLSPNTADRFERRGVIFWQPNGRDTQNHFFANERQQQRSREAALQPVDADYLYDY